MIDRQFDLILFMDNAEVRDSTNNRTTLFTDLSMMSFFESILGIDVNQAIALDILATANVLNVTRVLNILGISGNLNVK